MSVPQTPTNLDDILSEIRIMNQRIGALEQWKIASDAATAAVEKYKADEATASRNRLASNEAKSKTEVFKQVGYILALGGAILYAVAASKGLI